MSALARVTTLVAPGLEPTVEETALALEALAELAQHPPAPDSPRAPVGELRRALGAAALWLARATDEGTRFPASPIGLYFAKLWYAERLYPLLFTVAALERAARTLDAP